MESLSKSVLFDRRTEDALETSDRVDVLTQEWSDTARLRLVRILVKEGGFPIREHFWSGLVPDISGVSDAEDWDAELHAPPRVLEAAGDDARARRSFVEEFREEAVRARYVRLVAYVATRTGVDDWSPGLADLLAPLAVLDLPVGHAAAAAAELCARLKPLEASRDPHTPRRCVRLVEAALLYHDPTLALELRRCDAPGLFRRLVGSLLSFGARSMSSVLSLWELLVLAEDPAAVFMLTVSLLRAARESVGAGRPKEAVWTAVTATVCAERSAAAWRSLMGAAARMELSSPPLLRIDIFNLLSQGTQGSVEQTSTCLEMTAEQLLMSGSRNARNLIVDCREEAETELGRVARAICVPPSDSLPRALAEVRGEPLTLYGNPAVVASLVARLQTAGVPYVSVVRGGFAALHEVAVVRLGGADVLADHTAARCPLCQRTPPPAHPTTPSSPIAAIGGTVSTLLELVNLWAVSLANTTPHDTPHAADYQTLRTLYSERPRWQYFSGALVEPTSRSAFVIAIGDARLSELRVHPSQPTNVREERRYRLAQLARIVTSRRDPELVTFVWALTEGDVRRTFVLHNVRAVIDAVQRQTS